MPKPITKKADVLFDSARGLMVLRVEGEPTRCYKVQLAGITASHGPATAPAMGSIEFIYTRGEGNEIDAEPIG